MTNKNRINICIVILVIVAILLLLFSRWNQYSFGWGKGNISVSEASYYGNNMKRIIVNWMKTRDNANFSDDGYYDDSYQSYLVFDLAKQAMWMEDNSRILKDNYMEFPAGMKWAFYHITPNGKTELTDRIILKYRGFDTNRQIQEAFFLVGTGRGKGYLNCQVYGHGGEAGYNNNVFAMPQINFPSSTRNDLFGSLIVSDEEYKKYRDSLTDLTLPQSEQLSVVEQNKEAWNKIEKFLYQEIEKQVNAKGFKLRNILIIPGPDYSAANSKIDARNNNKILQKLFGGISRLDMTLKIDNLENDTWYVKGKDNSGLNPNQKSKYDIEFLVSDKNKIAKSQYNELLEKGRQIQKPFVIPESKWQTTLANGMKIEFLGICENPSAGKQWWGPDGTVVDYVPYINNLEYDKTNANSKVYEFVWRITHRPANFGIATSFEGSNGSNQSIYTDRYGLSLWPTNSLNIQTSSFDKSKTKTTFKILFDQNNTNKQTVLFKNISLVSGQNQGFEIEVIASEDE